MRFDGRELDQTRPVSITRHYIKHAPGSVLVEMGGTQRCFALQHTRKGLPCTPKAQGGGMDYRGVCDASPGDD